MPSDPQDWPTISLAQRQHEASKIERAEAYLAALAPNASAREEVRIINEKTGAAKGSKLARFDLLPWDVLWEVAELYGRGAQKYAERNWEKGYDWSLSIAALARHFSLFIEGEDIDPETQCHHMTSVIFHAMALIRYGREHPELDNRRGTARVREFTQLCKEGIDGSQS